MSLSIAGANNAPPSENCAQGRPQGADFGYAIEPVDVRRIGLPTRCHRELAAKALVIEILFLGTGGARFVVARQIRASGGMWMRFGKTQIHVDPGPGALVRALS